MGPKMGGHGGFKKPSQDFKIEWPWCSRAETFFSGYFVLK